MNKHEQLCKECAAKAGLRLSGICDSLGAWKSFWRPQYGDLIKYADTGCIVCYNNSDDLITDCVINVSVIDTEEEMNELL